VFDLLCIALAWSAASATFEPLLLPVRDADPLDVFEKDNLGLQYIDEVQMFLEKLVAWIVSLPAPCK
jgi:hypothetical protein